MRKWTVKGAIRNVDTRGCYYLDPGMQRETQRCLDCVQNHQLVLLSGARASGKTTQLFSIRNQLEAKGFQVLYLSLEGVDSGGHVREFWESFGSILQGAARSGPFGFKWVPTKPIRSQGDFLSAFFTGEWRREVVLLVDEFSELYHASEDIPDECLRAFRFIRNNHEKYAIRGIIAAGTFAILRLTSTKGVGISPFNISDHINNPYFTVKETRHLFDQFAQDNDITIEDDVVQSVWAKSNGDPGMVCLCGRTISNNMNTLLNHTTRTLSFHNWERFPVQQLYNDISAYNTFRSMIISLRHPTANAAVDLLRCYFAGFLDEVKVGNGEEENLADFLTAEGVLFRPNVSEPKFHMASALIDGLI